MNRNSHIPSGWQRRSQVVELTRRDKVVELAYFLGLDASVVAEGLVDAVQQDPRLKNEPRLHHAA
jgi:hypothetical protein